MSKKYDSNFIKHLPLASLIVSFGSLAIAFVYAVLTFRPLLGEAPTWYYRILGNHSSVIDPQFTRFTDVIINQGPTLFLVKLFGTAGNVAGLYLLTFMWAMHPLISLAICYIYLKSKDRLDLIYFAVLSLLFCSLPMLPLSVGMAALALSFFWPLLYYIILENKRGLKECFVIFVGLVALLYSYEPALLLFVILAGIAAYRMKTEKKYLSFDLFTFLFSIGSIVYLSGVIAMTNRFVLKNHWEWVFSIYEKNRMYAFLVGFSFVGYLFARCWSFKKVGWIFAGLFVAINSWYIYFLTEAYSVFNYIDTQEEPYSQYIFNFGPTTAFQSRATAIPVAFVIALGFLAWVYFNSAERSKSIFSSKRVVYSLSVMVFLVAVTDLFTSRMWFRSFDYYRNFVLTHEGCLMMPSDKYHKYMFEGSLQNISLPSMAVLVQVLDGRDEIRTLVFPDESQTHPEFKDVCALKKNSVYPLSFGQFELFDGYFKFADSLR